MKNVTVVIVRVVSTSLLLGFGVEPEIAILPLIVPTPPDPPHSEPKDIA